jgi:hypothetical protein
MRGPIVVGIVGKERTVTDPAGVVWEVFREDDDALAAILEWGHRPGSGDVGLLFSSTAGMRRLFPCPAGWDDLSDADLLSLLARASELY